ncbi:putative Protein KTI12 like protein [Blattamonas nauphoetae]|uniref:Uncharacterized protein n=1 Tax=Blattamonas nauphoetae TaxID=2049346 RepID=A0ABQ9Y696_9EUKA|nr:putative Protein KTI12 like protein [Blattamonas nauphoetae]
MPLLLICGPPASGKTTVANYLAEYFTSRNHHVIIVNEESLSLNKAESYQDNYGEMNLRSSLKTAVYQALSTPGTTKQAATPSSVTFSQKAKPTQPAASTSTICICDSLNYIRGVRYELFCIARQFLTTYALIYCNVPLLESYKWNDAEGRTLNNYPPSLFLDLTSRLEVPNQDNHWERPLFEIRCANPEVYDEFFLLGGKNTDSEGNTLKENLSLLLQNPVDEHSPFVKEEDDIDDIEGEDVGVWSEGLKQVQKLERQRNEYLEKRRSHLVADNDEDQEEWDEDQAKLYATESDVEIEERMKNVIPFSLIENALFHTIGLTPPQSTLRQTSAPSSTLYQYGLITQSIVTSIIDAQRVCIAGDSIQLPHCTQRFILPRHFTLNELRRLRQRFLTITQHTHSQTNIPEQQALIGDVFAEFILREFRSD